MRVCIAIAAFIAGVVSAADYTSRVEQVPVVELFTSQGCSSCPPADAWLGKLMDHPGLWKEFVPLAFHVDYWNYIGWKDRFAEPRNGNRQRAYRDSGRVRSVYTPGFVVNGWEWKGFFRGKNPDLSPGPRVGVLRLELLGTRMAKIRFEAAAGDLPKRLRLQLAVLGSGLSTPVGRGENSGKTLDEEFVVLGWHGKEVETAKGQWVLPLPIPMEAESKRRAVVAWLSPVDGPAPLQAVGGWLP